MSWETKRPHTDCHLISCYAALYRASGEPTMVTDVCQSASRMRRNYGDAAARHSTHNTQDHARTYQHQRQAHQHSNASQNNTRTSRSMEGGDGVVRARVEDANLAGSSGHGFRAGGTALPETCRPERTEEGRANRRAGGQQCVNDVDIYFNTC